MRPFRASGKPYPIVEDRAGRPLMGGSASAPPKPPPQNRASDLEDGWAKNGAHKLSESMPLRGDKQTAIPPTCQSPNEMKLSFTSDTSAASLSSGNGYEDVLGDGAVLSSEVLSWFKRRNVETLRGALAFVPWILQQAHHEGRLHDKNVLVHRGHGAVVFSDASGFTALTERLAMKSNGAEMLSRCLKAFFTPLINLIENYRGDVIKFSGDALTIYFPAVDDNRGEEVKMRVPPHGSYGLPDLGPMATAVLRASACCIEIHKRLHNFDTGIDEVFLCLHIGVGCGEVVILQVGGEIPPDTHVPRSEYLLAGPPLEQISIAEPLAKNGETCLSPQAWDYVKDCVVEDTRRLLADDFHLLLKMDETKYTFPTIKFTAMERDDRHSFQFGLEHLKIIRRFIPSPVFKQIEGGTLFYVNEMRHVSPIFLSISGVDCSTQKGAETAQELMVTIQRICYGHEGTLNKFLFDDKGMLFLLVFGLPPLVHTDDPTRAVLTCLDIIRALTRMGLEGRLGVTSGRAFCGVCGSDKRMEYTVLGDPVNLAARLMGTAPPGGIFIDDATQLSASVEIAVVSQEPRRVKGKADPINIYMPKLREQPRSMGIGTDGKLYFPWYYQPVRGARKRDRGAIERMLKRNVRLLCGVTDWTALEKVSRLLGEGSDRLQDVDTALPAFAALPRAREIPNGSPFAKGGVVFLDGHAGLGKIELGEHMATYAAHHLHFLPVVASIGPRLTDRQRLGVELVSSCVALLRYIDKSTPADDLAAIGVHLPPGWGEQLEAVKEALSGAQVPEERQVALLHVLVSVGVALLQILRRRTSIMVVMHIEFGTSLFEKTLEGFKCLWEVVSALAAVAMPSQDKGGHPIVLLVLSKGADETRHDVVEDSLGRGWFVKLTGLAEESCVEYTARYLKVPTDLLPTPLSKYVVKVSLGNPSNVRELIDQLIRHRLLRVEMGPNGPIAVHHHPDLEAINISAWAQTAMVGETVCRLESLDPLEAAVLKMSTVFKGPFALADLAAASTPSQWDGASGFDYLRLFQAIQSLMKYEILGALPVKADADPLSAPEARAHPEAGTHDETCESDTVSFRSRAQTFELRNFLVRKVGGSMVLQAQKQVVKRQALMARRLERDLPPRMEELRKKRAEPHIPWFYENALLNAT